MIGQDCFDSFGLRKNARVKFSSLSQIINNQMSFSIRSSPIIYIFGL